MIKNLIQRFKDLFPFTKSKKDSVEEVIDQIKAAGVVTKVNQLSPNDEAKMIVDSTKATMPNFSGHRPAAVDGYISQAVQHIHDLTRADKDKIREYIVDALREKLSPILNTKGYYDGCTQLDTDMDIQSVQNVDAVIDNDPHLDNPKTIESLKKQPLEEALKKAEGLWKTPGPETILGENYGEPFRWTHPDDMHVNFQVLSSVVMGDVGSFLEVIEKGSTGVLEKEAPYIIHSCFAEVVDVVTAHMVEPMKLIADDQYCFLVCYENVFGVILVSLDDAIDIMRKAIGVEEESDQLHYQLQFMRFSEKALKQFDVAGNLNQQYHQQQQHIPPLQVNFAKFQESE